ncbi:hypothetical protein EDB80DRAFT_720807 [Ilyonectria destructans]|nr:hypothetical protein EDB80DRAFT_720807 [Ilyonectria destructans]
MVGVAGRSIACHTCKQRKIRCAGEKPACSNCTKSGRSCAGYQRSHAFILSQYTVSTSTQLSESTSRPADESDPSPVLWSRWKKTTRAKSLVVPPKKRNLDPSVANPSLLVSISPRNAFRDQLITLFINDQYPSDIINHALPNPHRKWLLRLGSLPSLSPALEYTILAVCTAGLGRRDKHEDLQHKSLTLYTTGLCKLQCAIDSPITRYDEQTLTACMVLCMYEFTECPGKTVAAYMNHYYGAMELLRLRGAKAHAQGLSHGVFQALRMHTIFHGLRQRRTSFLAQPEWIEKPWNIIPKDSHDILLDLFLRVPGIMNKMDASNDKTKPKEVATKCVVLIRECLQFEADIGSWLSGFHKAEAGPLYWPELSNMVSESDTLELGRLFAVSLRFPSFRVAETMVLYWTLRALLSSCLCNIYRKLLTVQANVATHHSEPRNHPHIADASHSLVDNTVTEQFPLKETLPRLRHQEESLQTSARNICQSVDYFCHIRHRSLGPNTILSPLVVVRAIFSLAPENWDREQAWVGEMLNRIQEMGDDLVCCI